MSSTVAVAVHESIRLQRFTVVFSQKGVPPAVLVSVLPASHEIMPSGNIVYELQGTNDIIHYDE